LARRRRNKSKPGSGRPRAGAPGRQAETDVAVGWFVSKRPVLRFVLVFGVLVLVINVLLLARVRESPVVMRVLAWNAEATGVVLRLCGEEAVVHDRSVIGGRYALEVAHGCDAVQPTALFLSAVVATPVLWRRRLAGLAVGVAVLITANLIRIISLYYVGVYIPHHFELVHVEVWGAAFILLSIVLWLAWAFWAISSRKFSAAGDSRAMKS